MTHLSDQTCDSTVLMQTLDNLESRLSEHHSMKFKFKDLEGYIHLLERFLKLRLFKQKQCVATRACEDSQRFHHTKVSCFFCRSHQLCWKLCFMIVPCGPDCAMYM